MAANVESAHVLYEFYSNETKRLDIIFHRTKNNRIKSKIFTRIMKLKDKYDWTYDEVYKQKTKGEC